MNNSEAILDLYIEDLDDITKPVALLQRTKQGFILMLTDEQNQQVDNNVIEKTVGKFLACYDKVADRVEKLREKLNPFRADLINITYTQGDVDSAPHYYKRKDFYKEIMAELVEHPSSNISADMKSQLAKYLELTPAN